MNSVLKDWVSENCTWKQQTVLMCALRGPDSSEKESDAKALSRLLRKIILKNADPNQSFMRLGNIKHTVPRFIDNIEHFPLHFVLHLAHAFEIIGYLHPEEDIRNTGQFIYFEIVKSFHMKPETIEEMNSRLADNIS